MKITLSFLFATVLFLSTSAQNMQQDKKVLNQNGDFVNIFGFITKVNYLTDLIGSPTVMNFSGKDST